MAPIEHGLVGLVERRDERIRELEGDRDRYRDLLVRILASYEDGTINVPDVDGAIEAEIREVLR